MESVTVALITAVLSGMAGSNVDAMVALHAPTESIVWVNGEANRLSAGETRIVAVPINLSVGRSNQHITVVTESVTHELSVATIGERPVNLRWWIPLSTLPLILLSVRVSRPRKVVGSS